MPKLRLNGNSPIFTASTEPLDLGDEDSPTNVYARTRLAENTSIPKFMLGLAEDGLAMGLAWLAVRDHSDEE